MFTGDDYYYYYYHYYYYYYKSLSFFDASNMLALILRARPWKIFWDQTNLANDINKAALC